MPHSLAPIVFAYAVRRNVVSFMQSAVSQLMNSGLKSNEKGREKCKLLNSNEFNILLFLIHKKAKQLLSYLLKRKKSSF